MKTQAWKMALLAACGAATLSAAGCTPRSGRAFLANRTGIDVAEAPICGAMVADHEQCRPGDYGGVPWTKAFNFPPYSVPSRLMRDRDRLDERDEERIMDAVRAHYLASPYYAGDLHSVCKAEVDRDVFPGGATNLQRYSLAKVIEDRAVIPLSERVRKVMEDRDPPNAWAVTSRFHHGLMEEVHRRVQAKVLWFVTRYPGGLPDIARARPLRRCLQETRDTAGAQLVTGVAGYIVLDNRIDTAVGSGEVVYRALDRATIGRSDVVLDPQFQQSLALEWEEKVSRVAQIRMAREDATAVAWPMWVQLQ